MSQKKKNPMEGQKSILSFFSPKGSPSSSIKRPHSSEDNSPSTPIHTNKKVALGEVTPKRKGALASKNSSPVIDLSSPIKKVDTSSPVQLKKKENQESQKKKVLPSVDSPKSSLKRAKDAGDGSQNSRGTPTRQAARKRIVIQPDSSDEEGEMEVDKTPSGRHKMCHLDFDSDSDPEFKVDKKQVEDDDDDDEEEEEEEEAEASADTESEDVSGEDEPKANKQSKGNSSRNRKKSVVSTPSSRGSGAATSKMSSYTCEDFTSNDAPSGESDWPPRGPEWDFIRPEKIMDKEKRRPDHPDYDPKTLFVPKDFLKKQTPAQNQWWQVKQDNYDTILFFKVGKFYELFHMDGLVGIAELNLRCMGGSSSHAGFPESSYSKFMDILQNRGYRVARVEQTESNEARDKRISSSKHEIKAVVREICEIVTPGTTIISDMEDMGKQRGKYLLSIIQTGNELGVCFVDVRIGKFFVGQFKDDKMSSRLRSLLAYYPPAEILCLRNNLDTNVAFTIKNYAAGPLINHLSKNEFWSEDKTLKMVKQGKYFEDSPGVVTFPEGLEGIMSWENTNPDMNLCVRAIGAVVFWLKRCLIDELVLTQKNFSKYTPPDQVDEDMKTHLPSSMVLDSITLTNLDILDSEEGVKKSFLGSMDYTATKFGKREFRFWTCYPKTSSEEINNRLDASEDLYKIYKNDKNVFDFLNKLPDLPCILANLHRAGCKKKNDHPDSRAQMFTDYAPIKIKPLIQFLDGFQVLNSGMTTLQDKHMCSVKSTIIKNIITSKGDGGNFPKLSQHLADIINSFDFDEAKKSGKIIPKRGADDDYDNALAEIKRIKDELEQIRSDESRKLKTDIKFANSGKRKFMLEMTTAGFDKAGPTLTKYYKFEGTIGKNKKRFYIDQVEQLVPQLKEAEEEKDKVLKDISRRFCWKVLSEHRADWEAAISCVTLIDCLLSLAIARFSMESFTQMTRPELVSEFKVPFIHITEGKNPILVKHQHNFVSNDLKLENQLLILTGPNMGGKSTLMRQTALLTIMAQIGCYVPAAKMVMSPVDRVFTRLGAMDNIMEGESTFLVELNETSAILKHATPSSLILLDELGRGTSTYDGTAIACSVVQHLSTKMKARTIFSTHYHTLVHEFEGRDDVASIHMGCHTYKNDHGDEEIVFLYKVAPGDCPKSYGFNAARLAGIQPDVIKEAEEKANQLQEKASFVRLVQSLLKFDSKEGSASSTGKTVTIEEAQGLIQQLKMMVI